MKSRKPRRRATPRWTRRRSALRTQARTRGMPLPRPPRPRGATAPRRASPASRAPGGRHSGSSTRWQAMCTPRWRRVHRSCSRAQVAGTWATTLLSSSPAVSCLSSTCHPPVLTEDSRRRAPRHGCCSIPSTSQGRRTCHRTRGSSSSTSVMPPCESSKEARPCGRRTKKRTSMRRGVRSRTRRARRTSLGRRTRRTASSSSTSRTSCRRTATRTTMPTSTTTTTTSARWARRQRALPPGAAASRARPGTRPPRTRRSAVVPKASVSGRRTRPTLHEGRRRSRGRGARLGPCLPPQRTTSTFWPKTLPDLSLASCGDLSFLNEEVRTRHIPMHMHKHVAMHRYTTGQVQNSKRR
mmetsp:Transcript_38131/g.106127  ORF Transcript_38131/g.106127 Transcript_38131/m.106127 type:complete len:354 (+) Transcript_38131:1731-2792(+)